MKTCSALALLLLSGALYGAQNLQDLIEEIDFAGNTPVLKDGGGFEIDNIKSDWEWPTTFSFPKGGLKTGAFYRVALDYDVKFVNWQGGNFLFCEGPGGVDDRPAFVSFASKPEKGRVELTFALPESDKQYRVMVTSKGGTQIAVSGLTMESVPIPEHAKWFFEKDAFAGMRFAPSNGAFFDFNKIDALLPREKYFPMVDKFGQYKYTEWKGKVKDKSDLKERLAAEKAFNAKAPDIKNRDQYGGLAGSSKNKKGTGRFALDKVGGKWFLRDPEGNLFWSMGVDCVGGYEFTPISARENYFEEIPEGEYRRKENWGMFFYAGWEYESVSFMKRNIDLKYGKGASGKYGKISAPRMKKWGFNTYGAWSDHSVLRENNIPYTLIIGSQWVRPLDSKKELYGYWRPMGDFFAEEFEAGTEKIARDNADLIKSKYCVGVFVDNEMPWQGKEGLTAEGILTCPADQPAKIAFSKFLKEKYADIAKLNAAWGASFADWNAFLAERDFIPQTEAGKGDLLALERKYYERYFEVCKNAVKKVSPDVLYMGCRFAGFGWVNPLCMEVAAEQCDAVSANFYMDSLEGMELPDSLKDKPVIVGEFHFGSMDRGNFWSGLQHSKTGGERAEKFKKYMESAIKHPNIVGAHWFQWFDQSATGRFDGENAAIGIVDVCDTPDYDMVNAARDVSQKMYEMRMGK